MLVTLQDMKDYLGETTGTLDTFLTLQLEIISEAIEGYCGRKFLENTYTQYFYQDEIGFTEELPLYHYPINSVTSIEEAGVLLTDGFRVESEVGLLIRERYFWLQHRISVPTLAIPKIKVIYDAGYSVLPAPLQYVVFSWVQEKYNRKKAGIDLNFGSDVQRISIPGALSIDFDYTLDNNQRVNSFGNIVGNYMNVLDPYRSERPILGRMGRTYVE